MDYRYENQNSYPVVVPGKRGVGVTFAPGQWSTDPWFSRFCGPRRLTRAAVSGTPPRKSSPVPLPVEPVTPPMLSALEGVAEETTPNWVKKRGIYTCTHCSLFRTGSRLAMINHLGSYHQLEVEDSGILKQKRVPTVTAAPVPEVPKPVTATPVVEVPITERKPAPFATDTGSKEERVPEPSTPEAESEGSEPAQTLFTCPHCDRQYRTERGLAKHMARDHQ